MEDSNPEASKRSSGQHDIRGVAHLADVQGLYVLRCASERVKRS